MYGDVADVYASGASTLGSWMATEPNNTSGLGGGSTSDETMPLYAAFVQGDFTVSGPIGPKGPIEASYDEGRIVFDANGKILNIRMWSSKTHPNAPFSNGEPAFDSAFDDG
jgi:hypothetical protein